MSKSQFSDEQVPPSSTWRAWRNIVAITLVGCVVFVGIAAGLSEQRVVGHLAQQLLSRPRSPARASEPHEGRRLAGSASDVASSGGSTDRAGGGIQGAADQWRDSPRPATAAWRRCQAFTWTRSG